MNFRAYIEDLRRKANKEPEPACIEVEIREVTPDSMYIELSANLNKQLDLIIRG